MTTAEKAKAFLAFCELHPGLRFWQALAAFTSRHIYATDDDVDVRDTFYWENTKVEATR